MVLRRWGVLVLLSLVAAARPAGATGVPVGGFLPLVGIGLTDEFQDADDDVLFFTAQTKESPGGTALGSGGVPFYDLALFDTGANGFLLTDAADAGFNLSGNGFAGTNIQRVGGATGFMDTVVNNPLGLYATGLAAPNRLGTNPLVLDPAAMTGEINISMMTMPPESDLPNVLGLPFASQFTTYIRNDQPQIFSLNGQTVRTPQVEFLPLGSGGQGILRRAPISLQPGVSFAQPPLYIYNIENALNGLPLHENPTAPTIHIDGLASRGAMFVSVEVDNTVDAIPKNVNANFVFDTGADVTVLSELNASRLGYDVVLDQPEFTVAVVGSGGARLEVPGFFVDNFTVETVGGSFTANNVPVIVLNVTNPADPGNVVDGIVGMNVFAGRNLVIDPDPSLGGGNLGPQLYIGDSVTINANWSSTSGSASWAAGSSWSIGATPGALNIANVRNASGANQTAVVSTNATAWEVNVSGSSPSQQMTLSVQSGVTLTTFAGLNVEAHGNVTTASGSVLDVQYVDVRDGGRLSGGGTILTGSGPLPGQVENVSGVVAPFDGVGELNIEGRFSNGDLGILEIDVAQRPTGFQHDQLIVDGPATLAGTLKVISLASPPLGSSFEILTASDGIAGEFALLDLPALAAGSMWHVAYEETSVLLAVTLPGDFDGDFTVDADDLVEFRNDYGTTYGGQDFLAWQRNLGMSVSPIGAVPEPSGMVLAAAAMLGGGARRKRRV